MKPWRRITGWLALLGVILYGLTPTFACLAPRGIPLACATAAEHQCSCHPDPHHAKACCCSKKDGGADCSMGKLPCDGGAPTDVAQTVAINPLSPAPAGVSILLLPRAQAAPATAQPAPRAIAADPHVPPPRLRRAVA